MGLIYLKNEEKRIYEAYGMTVYGKRDRYNWSIYLDRPDENVYTSLRIERDEKNILDVHLGNLCIFEENFNRTIDNFLWWIDKDNPNSYDIRHAMFKSLTKTDSLFNHLIENRKRKEQADANEKARVEAIKKEEQRQIDLIKQYCEKENLLFKQYYEKAYLPCYIFNISIHYNHCIFVIRMFIHKIS